MVSISIHLIAIMASLVRVKCFMPHTFNQKAKAPPGLILFAKRKQSMAQKRKRRAGRTLSKTIERPKILDTVARTDEWTKTVSTSDQVETMKGAEDAKAQASALIETQRKSVDVLTHVRNCVESLPYEEIIETVLKGDAYVKDGFLGSELCEELKLEGESLLTNEKMELDLQAGLCSGEFATAIKGGEDQYSHCPRCVEYVVR